MAANNVDAKLKADKAIAKVRVESDNLIKQQFIDKASLEALDI